ncbi:hypothetical protein AQUCO_11300003v1 [Aquilegia coerulea]|uniref:DUF1068 domain-containing protein n=1 Tax=Aquilegia coerulea TaxID=218851 RepID=A0A2G5C2I1_AQUCA|nr:hypothetical protein AQUCO_11300003v1 [Aquilegia coerulea]
MGGRKSGGSCSSSNVLKIAIVLLSLSLFGYLLGPPLYWHITEALATITHSSSSTSSSSCPTCNCDCSSQPLLSIPLELSNTSFADCVKHNPDVSEDMEKNFTELLSEELKLREAEALDNQRHADMALLEAKKMASQYQKEADKCNSGMETCEEAREKAEDALVEQRRLTATWELRARQRGWKEGLSKSHSQS